MPDIAWRGECGSFKYRVAALIRHADSVLLCEVDGLDYTILPGGKVRLGEDTRAALTREIGEELGRELRVGALSLIVENLYHNNGLHHEVGFYYDVPWPDHLPEDVARDSSEPGHHFHWIPIADLHHARLQPAALIPDIQTPTGSPRHILLDRRNT